MLLGAHLSIAGGVDKVFARAEAIDCTALQIFTKSNRQWKARPLKEAEVARYHERQAETGIPVVCHASYLINIASPKESVWQKSFDALIIELERCETLKIPNLVLHPGSHTGSGVEAGLKKVSQTLDQIYEQLPDCHTKVTLEITAGQGTTLGASFEEIKQMIEGCQQPERLAVCFDTCHALAAGYEFRTPETYTALINQFDELIGLPYLEVFHFNDSAKELGSHVDRHAHIGEGHIGTEPFGYFLNDSRFKEIPFLLETPVDEDPEDNIHNLETLRSLIKQP